MMDGMYGANPLFGYNNNNSNVHTRFGANDDVNTNDLIQQELEQEINREEQRQQQQHQLRRSGKGRRGTSRKRKDDNDDDDEYDDDDDDDVDGDDTDDVDGSNGTRQKVVRRSKKRNNSDDDDDDDDDSSSTSITDDDDSDNGNAKKTTQLKKNAKPTKQGKQEQQQLQRNNKNRQYALSNVKLRKNDKLHMKRLMRGILKQAKQNEEEKLFKTITQTVLGTLNPASTAATAAATGSRHPVSVVGQKRSRNDDDHDDDDDDDDDDNTTDISSSSSSSSSYLKRARKYHDSQDGKFNSVAHKQFINDLQDKLTKFNSLGVQRIKELDTTHNLEDLPLTGKDKYMSSNSSAPTVTIKEPLFEILTDHYCKSVLVNSILRKVLPFVDIPYIKK